MEKLHPIIVHFPLALAILWPLVDAAGLLWRRPDVGGVGVALLLAALAASFLATVTGQAAFDAAIAQGHSAGLLEQHADLAGLLPWALLLVVFLRLGLPRWLGARARVLALMAGVGVASLALFAGLTGGQLVYQHAVGVQGGGPRK